MAWYSYAFGATVTPELAAQGLPPRELLGALPADAGHVLGASRGGALLHTLRRLLASAGQDEAALYLLQDQALLGSSGLTAQLARIEDLLDAIGRDPHVAVEATREAHVAQTTVHGAGLASLACEVVYPPDCRTADGWVYFHTEEQVRADLAAAIVGSDPKPAADDEGESLAFVFGFLKSHAALLRTAAAAGLCVAYAEMNPPD